MTRETGSEPRSDSAQSNSLQVQGNRVVLGEWSGDLTELIAEDVELREMLRSARYGEARALVQTQSAEEQAALVTIDENPEEVLSLTGMDERGKPGYRPEVVEKLPADIVAEVLVPRNSKLVRFNAEILRQMSPEAFDRVVGETLDQVYYHGNRAQVSWEWLEAVAALKDDNKIAELLFEVDQTVLEDALIQRMDAFDMHATFAAGDSVIWAFSALAESGRGVMLPPITDPEVAEVVHALHGAAAELMAKVICNAWERAGGGMK